MAPKQAKPRPTTPSRGGSAAAAAARTALFIEHYLAPGSHFKNGTQAAIAAGYSPKSAASRASRLLADVKVRQEIATREAEIIAAAQQATNLSVEDVLRSLARSVKFDPRKLVGPDGKLKALQDLSDDEALALEGFEFTTDKDGKVTVTAYKVASRTTGRDQALKHLGLIKTETPPPPDVNVTVNLKVPPLAPLKEVFARKFQQHGSRQ